MAERLSQTKKDIRNREDTSQYCGDFSQVQVRASLLQTDE